MTGLRLHYRENLGSQQVIKLWWLIFGSDANRFLFSINEI